MTCFHMTASFPLDLFQRLFWDQMQDAARAEQVATAWRAAMSSYLVSIGIIVAVSVLLLGVCLVAYRPRVPRGALWTPAYGLFGGAPKLYYHSRPPSLFGIFLHSRHRISSGAHARTP